MADRSEPCNCEQALELTDALERLHRASLHPGIKHANCMQFHLAMDHARAVLTKWEGEGDAGSGD